MDTPGCLPSPATLNASTQPLYEPPSRRAYAPKAHTADCDPALSSRSLPMAEGSSKRRRNPSPKDTGAPLPPGGPTDVHLRGDLTRPGGTPGLAGTVLGSQRAAMETLG